MLNCNLFLWSKLYFQHHYCSLQCHMMFRNHNNMLLKKLLLLLSMLKTVEYIFSGFFYEQRSKDQHLSEIKSFCNIIHYHFLRNKLILLFIKDALNWSKVMINTFIMLQKISISDKCCSSELCIHQRNQKKKILLVYYYDFWRSCDTEDWSNDAENTALITEINYSLTHIHIENSYFK